FSAGQFGGGSDQADNRFGHFDGRTDLDVLTVWSLQNFGLGNLAVQRRQRAVVGEAVAERLRVIDQVRRGGGGALSGAGGGKRAADRRGPAARDHRLGCLPL